MKIRIHIVAILSVVLFLFASVLPAGAQSNFVLHTFTQSAFQSGVNGVNTNGDGVNPSGWLTLVGGTMYGTAINGGTNGTGTLFSINTNGAFNLLYTFPTNLSGTGNFNGANPNGGLVFSNGLLYGTTSAGGIADQGEIFSINTNGTGITILHSFTDASSGNNADGANPAAGLIIAGTNLFGTTPDGGTGGNGVVFACNSTVSNSLKILHYFTLGALQTNIVGLVTNVTLTNSDGAKPNCGLVLSGITLYGTASAGGTNGAGTVFAINTNGLGFTVLHYFSTTVAGGANPNAGLVLSGGTLYGVSGSALYALNTNGTGFTILKQFDNQLDGGTFAESGLTVSNCTLYGVGAKIGAYSIGPYSFGQVFAINTNGANFASLHDFTEPLLYPTPPTNADGIFPSGGLVQLNTALFGAASAGGTNGSGVIFKASPPPTVVSPQYSSRNFTMTFPVLAGMSYTVQQNTNLIGTNWITFTNFMGGSMATQFTLPATNKTLFFRVRQP